jgi:cytochrome b
MSSSGRKIFVWDAPTRLFHWLTVALVVAAYATWRLNWIDWHVQVGDALLALLLFRLLLGVLGSETTRFSRFLASPRLALRHLARMFHREPDRQAGHNPAGGWMVLLLIALLFGETLTGIYVANDVADVGPFTELAPPSIANAITALHLIFWEALLVAMGLHVLAIFVYAVVKGHNLVLPMITGWKTLPDNVPQPRMMGASRTLLLFGCSVAAAAAIANFL